MNFKIRQFEYERQHSTIKMSAKLRSIDSEIQRCSDELVKLRNSSSSSKDAKLHALERELFGDSKKLHAQSPENEPTRVA